MRTERGRRCPTALRGGAYSVLATEFLGRPPKKPRTSVLDVFFRRRSAASLRPNSQELALTRVRSRPAGGAPRSSSSEGDGCSLPGGQTELALARRHMRASGPPPRSTVVEVGEAHGHQVPGRGKVVPLVAPGRDTRPQHMSPKRPPHVLPTLTAACWTHSKRTRAKDWTSL